VASLFHADPKTEMDEDLMRMKVFVETGARPRDAWEAGETYTQREEQPEQETVGTRRRGRGNTGPDLEEMG
jgi:hypothetical protein